MPKAMRKSSGPGHNTRADHFFRGSAASSGDVRPEPFSLHQPRVLRCERLSSPSNEQDDQHDYEDGAEPAADVRTAKVEAAAAEQNDQDDQKDNQVHDILPVECGVAR